jgi:hypothetical protein
MGDSVPRRGADEVGSVVGWSGLGTFGLGAPAGRGAAADDSAAVVFRTESRRDMAAIQTWAERPR